MSSSSSSSSSLRSLSFGRIVVNPDDTLIVNKCSDFEIEYTGANNSKAMIILLYYAFVVEIVADKLVWDKNGDGRYTFTLEGESISRKAADVLWDITYDGYYRGSFLFTIECVGELSSSSSSTEDSERAATRKRFNGYRLELHSLDASGPAYYIQPPHPYYYNQPMYWQKPYYSYSNRGGATINSEVDISQQVYPFMKLPGEP